MAVPLFAELHWYSGGLRHLAVTPDSAGRPDWAPPADWAGFTEDTPLAEGEHAVEFRRASHGGHRATWVAVYARSVDTKFGDRGNHAGVGIWMREGLVTDGPRLLKGLRTLTDAIAANEDPETLSGDVLKFARDFAPRYIAEAGQFPAELTGLAHAGKLAETLRFRAAGDDCWRDTGERIEALGLFPEPGGRAARALFRLNGADDGAPPARGTESLVGRLAAALPSALATSETAITAARSETTALRHQLAGREAALESARAALDTAEADRTAAQQSLERSQAEIRRYDRDFTPSLASALDALNNRLSSIEQRIDQRRPAATGTRPQTPSQPRQGTAAWFPPTAVALLALTLLGVLWLLFRPVPSYAPSYAPVPQAAAPAAAQPEPEPFPGDLDPTPSTAEETPQ